MGQLRYVGIGHGDDQVARLAHLGRRKQVLEQTVAGALGQLADRAIQIVHRFLPVLGHTGGKAPPAPRRLSTGTPASRSRVTRSTAPRRRRPGVPRSEAQTYELQSLMRRSYA